MRRHGRLTAWVALAAALVTLGATRRAMGQLRVAVMPFKPLTASKGHDWIGPGLAETLTAALAAVPDLRVVERSQLKAVQGELKLSSEQLAEDEGALKVGRLIAARRLVLGSFQIAGGEILINGRFVDTQTGVVAQGQTFQLRGRVDRLFDLYPQLTARVLKTLGVEVSGKAAEAVQAVHAATQSLPAQEFYVEARERFHERTVEGMQKAVELLQKAKLEDPSYALAFASLAEAQAELGNLECSPFYGSWERGAPERCSRWFEPADEEFAQRLGYQGYSDAVDKVGAQKEALRKRCDRWPQVALANANTAASLSPSLPAAHRALGLVYWYSGNRRMAEVEARTLINLNRGDAWGYYLLGLCSSEPEESRQWHQRSLEIDENLAANYSELAAWAVQEGGKEKEEEARAVLDKGLRLSFGHQAMRLLLAQVLLRMGQPKAALTHLDLVLARSPLHPFAHFLRGLALWMAGGPQKPWDLREQWMDAAYLEIYRAQLWDGGLCRENTAGDPWKRSLPEWLRRGDPWKALARAYGEMRSHVGWHDYDLERKPRYCATAPGSQGKALFLAFEGDENKVVQEYTPYMLYHPDRLTEQEVIEKWWNEFSDRTRIDFVAVVCAGRPVTPDDQVQVELLFDGKPQPAFSLTADGHDPVYAGVESRADSPVGGVGRFTRRLEEFRVRGRFKFAALRKQLEDGSTHTLMLRVKANGKPLAEGKIPFRLNQPEK
jgi:TolB-like protein/Tfp pilus assembly protein PilF